MAATDKMSKEPSLLSWKGMQLWSVGYRAPAICEMFMLLKAKKLSGLISRKKKQKRRERRKQAREDDDGVRHSWTEEDAHSPSAGSSSLQLTDSLSYRFSPDDTPHRHSISIECLERFSYQGKRNSDATASNLKDILRRNSDAALHHLHRLSLSPSASSPRAGYHQVWVLGSADESGGLDHGLQKEMKLGGRRSDASVQLERQDSSMSASHRASCASFSSSSSTVASATSAFARLVHVGSHEREQRHLISQLLVGNQFLTRVTAAPVPSAAERMRPSDGLLSDAGTRFREAELKDRIIFFL